MRIVDRKVDFVHMEIRDVELADAPGLVELGRRTYAETFGDGYPPKDLAEYLAQAYTQSRFEEQILDETSGVWILANGNNLCGYVTAGKCTLPDNQICSSHGEIKRLYLLSEYQGLGWGTKLFETALNWLISAGMPTICLGVWSENYGAQKLYRRYGFKYAGEYEFIVGQTRDREFIYRKDITAKAAGYSNIKRGSPGYEPRLDRDNDGIACES